MKYIIDGNNLAGKLNLLNEKNFDKVLIKIIKCYNKIKNKNIILVFDSVDPMGDKYEDDELIIIYTPNDNYYFGQADNKIIEIVDGVKNEEIAVVTDDLGIEKIINIHKADINANIKIIKASHLALLINEKNFVKDKEGLTLEDKDIINKELLKIWKDKI